MSATGSPATARMSASYPAASRPLRSPTRQASAAAEVTTRKASTVDAPGTRGQLDTGGHHLDHVDAAFGVRADGGVYPVDAVGFATQVPAVALAGRDRRPGGEDVRTGHRVGRGLGAQPQRQVS